MSARLSPALTRVRALLADALSPTRLDTLDRLIALGLPTPRDDAFRYTNLRLLDRRDLAPAAAGSNTTTTLPADLPIGADRLGFLNGHFDVALSRLPATLRVETAPRTTCDAGSISAVDRIRLLNTALSGTHTTVVVPRNTQVSLDLIALSTAGCGYPSLTFQVESGAQLHVIEQHTGADEVESLTAAVIDFELQDGAIADHTLLQVAGNRAVVIGDVRAHVGRDATYRHRSAALGAQLSRFDVTVHLNAAGASTALSGLFLADSTREHHLRTLIHHAAPDCPSDQLYRGVASGRGRGSYDGKVIVDAGANGTNSAQSSKNLLLSPDASIETRPQLEINAHAVKCSHGATTGSLDENMLFYLLSRGLDRDTARAVLTYAFLGDVLKGFTPAIRAFVEARALGRLPAADRIREFVA